MKKFLCYDTNDAASGKINVDSRGMLKPNSTVPSTNGSSYQQLVTDGSGNTKWEDRLAYDDSKLVVDTGHGAQLIKVSDEVPSWASIDSPIKVWDSNGHNATVPPEEYIDLGNGSFTGNGAPFFITTDNFEFNGLVIPEKGVYFFSMAGVYMTGVASADSDTPEITWDGNIGEIKKIDEKFLPEIPAEKLPDIPAKKLPDIPAEKLPDIPAKKLPDIPAEKLPDIPVIEVNRSFSETIENTTNPTYTVNNLKYSDILSIFNGNNFVIKDTVQYYRPTNFYVSTSGVLFVTFLVNNINTTGHIIVAELACSSGTNAFYRNNYWTIDGSKPTN